MGEGGWFGGGGGGGGCGLGEGGGEEEGEEEDGGEHCCGVRVSNGCWGSVERYLDVSRREWKMESKLLGQAGC